MSTSSPFSPPEESAPAWILVATSRLCAAQAELDRTLYRVPWSLTQLLRHPCEDDWIWKQKIQLSRQEQVVLFILLPVLSIIATQQGVALTGSLLNTMFSATQRAVLTFMVSAFAMLHRLRYTLWHDHVRKPVKERLQVLDVEAGDLARALEASLKAELATLKAATEALAKHRATLQGPLASSATAQTTNAVSHLVKREHTVVDPPDISAHELTALVNDALQEAAALTDRLSQQVIPQFYTVAHNCQSATSAAVRTILSDQLDQGVTSTMELMRRQTEKHSWLVGVISTHHARQAVTACLSPSARR